MLFFLVSISIFSQIDSNNKSIRIAAEASNKEVDSLLKKIKVAPKFASEKEKADKTNKVDKTSDKKFVFKETRKPFSITENDGLKDPGEIFEAKWKKEATKRGIVQFMSDQFLGEHKIDSKFVNIICRDHGFPDGDRVRLIVNDGIVYPNVLLTNSYRRLQINLIEGTNKIDILALNQGDSGPNTAEFMVYDDQGNLISSKEWNLLTGVTATIIFVNQKKVDLSSSKSQEKKTEQNSSN